MTSQSIPAGRNSRSVGLVCLALLVLLLLPTWLSFIPTWSEERSHGFLITAYCIWLLWTRRATLRFGESVRWDVVAVAIAAAVLWAAALIVGSRVLHQGAAALVLLAWGYALLNAAARSVLAVVAALFLLALPVWEVLLPFLQGVTIAVNHLLIGLLHIPADLHENLIQFPFGTIEVAQSCAGLAFFMTAVSIGAIYAQHFLATPPARIAAVALAMALAMVSNWLRVFGLVYIGFRSKMQSPLMADHNTYGWIIFAVVMVVYFTLTARLEKWDRALAGAVPKTIARSFDGARDGENGRSLPLVTALTALPLMAYFALDLRGYQSTLPVRIPGVQGAIAFTVVPAAGGRAVQWTPAFRGEALRTAELRMPVDSVSYRPVRIDRFGYEGAREGRELIGYGNNIADGRYVLQQGTVGPLDAALRTVNQAIVRDSTGVYLAWYWYTVADVQTASATRAKLLELAAFLGRRTPSEVTVLSAPCDAKDCNRAVSSLYLLATGRVKP